MNLHNKIVQYLRTNPELLGAHVELFDVKVFSDVSLSNYGDLDLLVTGSDYDLNFRSAIVEIKSHKGLVAHYLSHQLPKYRELMPDAKQLVGYLKENSSDVSCENLEFLEFN